MWYFILPLVSVWFVARCLWKPMIDETFDDDNEEYKKFNIKKECYTDKYPYVDTYDRYHKPYLTTNNYIMESTPDGLVIMNINRDMYYFSYWSDHSIRYDILNTVARKLCCQFNCWGYYVCNDGYVWDKSDSEESSDDDDDDDDEFNNLFLSQPKKNKINKKEINIMNRFCYKGRIKDFSPLQPHKKTSVKNISFKDYKLQKKITR